METAVAPTVQAYMEEHNINELLDRIVKELAKEKPADPKQFLSKRLTEAGDPCVADEDVVPTTIRRAASEPSSEGKVRVITQRCDSARLLLDNNEVP